MPASAEAGVLEEDVVGRARPFRTERWRERAVGGEGAGHHLPPPRCVEAVNLLS